MKIQKRFWQAGSVTAGAAVLAASLAIPLVASANTTHRAATVHCSAKHDNVVDVSQFVNDKFTGTASSQTCTVTLSGSYTPNKIIAPVTVTTTAKVTAGSAGAPGGITG